MRARSYYEEFEFVRKSVPSLAERIGLLSATIKFHLNNGLRRTEIGSDGLEFNVRIGDEFCRLFVRPSRGDLFILYEVLAREAYCIPVRRLDPDQVRVIVDCGANIGITALYLASKYKRARIVCIEPDPDNFAILKRNVASHGRIEPFWAAVVSKSGSVHLTQDRPAYGNLILSNPDTRATIEVPGVTIDDICLQKNISRIDLLKIDIEGAEKEVFENPDFLRKVGLVAIELHAPYNLPDSNRAIAPHGFRAQPPGPSTCRHAHLASPADSTA